jgi:hypothetical protein
MIRYIPFLKAKRGELTAMGALSPKVKQAICPFFDFPRKKAEYDSATYADTAQNIVTSLKKHWGTDAEFYFDDLDIGQKLTVGVEEKYAYTLERFREMRIVPVVGLNRLGHNASVAQLKRNGSIGSDTVALRVLREDFEDFDVVKDEIEDGLAHVFGNFAEIDLVLDCRLCSGTDISQLDQQIAAFAKRFRKAYPVRRVIVTGSSVPASFGDLLKVNTTGTLARLELEIIAKARRLADVDLVTGDYATVSPLYSDADLDPKLMQTVMTPRLIYPFKHSLFLIRGSSMKLGGQDQYVGLTKYLCGRDFFRSSGYSTGDDYFYEKSQGIGNNATNATVVKPSVVAHITYMVLDVKL